MEKRALKESFSIKYSEMDCNLVLKPAVLLQFLQDLASDNAEQLGFGYSYIIKKNLTWFLLKYRMEFEDYPSKIDNIQIETEPRGYNKLFAFRNFKILNGEKLLGKVSSSWALVDIDSKNIISVGASLDNNPNMPPYMKDCEDLDFEKIKPLSKVDTEKIFEVRFDDIDVNGHANNSNYIIWAFEPLGFEFLNKHRLKILDMVFKKEIKYGCKVLSQIELLDNITNHVVKNAVTGEELCIIRAEWTEQ